MSLHSRLQVVWCHHSAVRCWEPPPASSSTDDWSPTSDCKPQTHISVFHCFFMTLTNLTWLLLRLLERSDLFHPKRHFQRKLHDLFYLVMILDQNSLTALSLHTNHRGFMWKSLSAPVFVAFYCLFAVIVLASSPTADFLQDVCVFGCIFATFLLFFAYFCLNLCVLHSQFGHVLFALCCMWLIIHISFV